MNLRNSFFIVWTLLASATGCKQQLDVVSPTSPVTSTDPSGTESGAVTEIGQPQGTSSSQLIGPQGGTVRSTDGAVDLVIPAGALTTATTITIQPITNQAPNGVGLAYRFSPDGTQFAKAAHLTFHYDAGQVAVNDPDMLAAGFQQTDRRWQRASDIIVDTTNRLISVAMPHFSDWTAYELERLEDLDLEGGPDKGKTLDFGQSATINVTEAFLIAPLTETKHETFKVKDIVWSVVGGEANGKLVTKTAGLQVTYTAPAKYPPQNPVTVQAEITFKNSAKKVFLRKRILIGSDYFTGTFGGEPFEWSQIVCTKRGQTLTLTGTNEAFTQSLNVILTLPNPDNPLGAYPYTQGMKTGAAVAEFSPSVSTYDGYVSYTITCVPAKYVISPGNVIITGFDEVDGVNYVRGTLSGTYYKLSGPCPAEIIGKQIQGEFRTAVAE
ncbi:hypothetical protein [Spirosoma radiotolerans]|uniref:hypothetical protein n=1 Tax=Spirosoma radiotolerans TaxID=1379870 RepID=UPI00069731C5|nr:hypothetical protein [Spirosoma radiotolerans]